MASTSARSATVSWGAFAVTVLATVLTAPFGAMWLEVVLGGAVIAASAVVGLLLTLRRPSNPIGWLLTGNGVLLALGALMSEYNGREVDAGAPFPAVLSWTVWLEESGWVLLFAPLTAVVFLFPDGRLPPPPWRRVALAALVPPVVILAVHLVSAAPFDAPYASVEPPLPVLPSGVAGAIIAPAIAGVLAGLLAAALAARARLRRAHGVERTQMLWLAYAALGLPLTLVLCLAGLIVGSEALLLGSLVVTLIAIPASIGIAVLRYQLLDIELVLSRTLVYGVLTVGVVACYAGVVVGLSALIGSEGAAGLVAAGLVAVGIHPLRVRLQKRVDRFVYGDRSDPYHALTRLTERLHSTLAPAQVVEAIVESVAEALRLRYVAIEFDRGGATEVAAAHGVPLDSPTTRIPLTYQGETIAQLAIQMPPGREAAPADRRLLDELARPAASPSTRCASPPTCSVPRRLVTAREEERRRLRRDLHDGLGPIAGGLVLKVDAARRASSRTSRASARRCSRSREETRCHRGGTPARR